MDFETIRSYCLSKELSREETPFGPEVLVYKVGGKIFALLGIDDFDKLSLNLKNTPEANIDLREEYAFIIPGYHMNKKHWNTISIIEGIDQKLVLSLIDQSYQCVFESLPKKVRSELLIS